MSGENGVNGALRVRGNNGRPSKLTPEAIETIHKVISEGKHDAYAAKAAGMTPCTLGNHKRKAIEAHEAGEDGDPFYQAFYERLEDAYAEQQALLEQVVTDAALKDGQWAAASVKLERKFPRYWNKNQVEVSGKIEVDGSPWLKAALACSEERQLTPMHEQDVVDAEFTDEPEG